MIKPANDNVFTLKDIKNSGAPSLFFDMIFDLKKYDHHIRRIDPMFRELDDVTVNDASGEKLTLT